LIEQKYQFAYFQTEHDKNYADEEDAMRFEIFKENLNMITEHNAKFEKGETTYKMGLNKMSDWTKEERSKMLGARPPTQV
jgi:DNA-directed RNA polymerase subunit E'/Rpb7